MRRFGFRSGGIQQKPEPRIAPGHRGAESRREVAVPAGGGAFRAHPGARSAADRVLVVPEERTGNLHVLVVQHRRGGERVKRGERRRDAAAFPTRRRVAGERLRGQRVTSR